MNESIDFSASEDLGYVLGVLAGDGCISSPCYPGGKKRVRLSVNDLDFANSFRQALQNIGLKAPVFNGGKTSIGKQRFEVRAYNNSFADWYRSQSTDTIIQSLKSSQGIMAAYVRGFFDSEGTSSLTKKGQLCIMIYNSQFQLLEKVRELLACLMIKSFILRKSYSGFSSSPRYVLEIVRKASVKIFVDLIGSNIQRKKETMSKWINAGAYKYQKNSGDFMEGKKLLNWDIVSIALDQEVTFGIHIGLSEMIEELLNKSSSMQEQAEKEHWWRFLANGMNLSVKDLKGKAVIIRDCVNPNDREIAYCKLFHLPKPKQDHLVPMIALTPWIFRWIYTYKLPDGTIRSSGYKRSTLVRYLRNGKLSSKYFFYKRASFIRNVRNGEPEKWSDDVLPFNSPILGAIEV